MRNVIIVNPAELERKLSVMRAGGADALHVLSALTRAYFNGEKTPSLISHLRNGKYLTAEYAGKAQELFEKYHPVELSTQIALEEKKRQMFEWWSAHYKLLVECGLDIQTMKKAVDDLIKEGKLRLRAGAKKFFEILSSRGVPLIMMSSAGIGNMVVDFLEKQKAMHPNIYFIGNYLKFDEEGRFIGVKDNEIIHSFNKNEIEIKHLPVYAKIQGRKNILLLGDSLGDLGMAEGADFSEIIKICFFGSEKGEDIEEFKRHYDILLTGDGSIDYVGGLVKKIFEK